MPRAPELSRRKVHVVAGILCDLRGRVLISDRRRAKSMRDYWEFPGGKIRRGESAQDALRRELGEELGIVVCDCEFLQTLEHDYPALHVEIDFFLVNRWRGKPTGLEGQALQWLQPVELSAEILLPADVPVLGLLKDL